MPNFSVIIPAYNAQKTIKKCIKSIINQTYNNWQAIVVNDGSNDDTESIVNTLIKDEPRISIISIQNSGPGNARNIGIINSIGNYIIFVDSDDYVEEDYFYDLSEVIRLHSPDIIYNNIIFEKISGKIIRIEKFLNYNYYSKDRFIRNQITGKIPWGAVRKVVKTSIIKENNITFSSDTVGEEAIYTFKILYKAVTICFLKNAHYHYINHPNSQSKKGDMNPWGNVVKKMKEYLQNENLFNYYESTFNSLALTTTIISLYRISNHFPFTEASIKCKQIWRSNKSVINFHLDYKSLETRILFILPFIFFNCTMPIIIASKLKNFLFSKW